MHFGSEPVPTLTRLSFVLWLLFFFLPPAGAASSTTGASGQVYSRPSWGLGVVLPEGSQLQGGGGLQWEHARNITATVTLPTIEYPSDTVYAIMSVMTADGVVLQVATGIYPGNSTWLVYSMYLADVTQTPQRYSWVLNSSAPRAAPGDYEVISIFLSQPDGWSFRVADPRQDSYVQRSFGLSSNQPAMVGDQESFALESYSWDQATFERMGSMVLSSILVDGQRVDNGFYSYADWDMVHSPLFIVGGAAPPQFVSLGLNGSTATWSYGGTWQGDIQRGSDAPIVEAFLLLLAVALVVVVISMLLVTRRAGRK